MKKKVIALALIIGAATIVFTNFYHPNSESTDNAYVHADVTAISPEVGGQVSDVFIRDNQWVKKGTPLFAIDKSDYLANQQIARSSLDVVKATIVANKTQLDMQQVKIKQAQQAIYSARANANLQRAELKRYTRLHKKNSVSKNQLEVKKAGSISANTHLETAKLGLLAEKKQYQSLLTQKQQLLAQSQKAQASLRLANIALKRTTVIAPFDGYVTNRQVQVGKFVQPGMGLITMVPNHVWIQANFKESQLGEVNKGQDVEVVLDMYPDRELTGHVESITPATGAQFSLIPAQNATGNFVKVVQRVPVRIQLDVPEDLQQHIYPGLSAEVSIHTH